MISWEIFVLGLSLATDAAVAMFAIGLHEHHLPIFQKAAKGNVLAILFGFFQFLMLWMGSRGGFYLSFSNYGYLFQLVVALIFVMLGGKCFKEAQESDRKIPDWKILPMLLLAVATSIDALAAGVSLGTLPMAWMAAIEVGVITFFSCILFFLLSHFFKNIPDNWLLRLAGVTFFILGGKIIIPIVFRGIS